MSNLVDMIWVEQRKAVRSRVPVFTALGFLMMPLVSAFLMIVLKDPEIARQSGLISAKANLVGGSADWPSYLSMLSQGIAVAGLFLFSLITSWVFGREFADGTLTDMFAVPVPRWTILLAKFFVVAAWCLGLTVFIYAVGLVVGHLVVLPGGAIELILQASSTLAVTACLVLIVITPMALFASIGRGYLLPMGIVFLIVGLSQFVAVIGYGSYCPWAIPGLYADLNGQATLEPVSYLIVLLTGLGGFAGTYLWWRLADQSR